MQQQEQEEEEGGGGGGGGWDQELLSWSLASPISLNLPGLMPVSKAPGHRPCLGLDRPQPCFPNWSGSVLSSCHYITGTSSETGCLLVFLLLVLLIGFKRLDPGIDRAIEHYS
ncbi:unnamed protein product [Pleuronectes platessa]|uniref:Uncharacterized protein n=1 Tax=Pleuronectes platessa TaxID=8262 RepID=A0A9N7VGT4_PLEPL|nr:unnamed protein product [Pleuronectes platessa]